MGLAAVATFGLRFVAQNQASQVIAGLAKDFKVLNYITKGGFKEVAAVVDKGGLAGKIALGTSAFVAQELMQGLARTSTKLMGALSDTLKKAAEFEENMQAFAVIGGKAAGNVDVLKQRIVEFTAPLPTTANEVAKAAVEFAKMGFAANASADSMIKLSFEAIKFGRAIKTTDAQAALFLGKLATWLAIANPTAEKMNEIASIVTRLGWSVKGTAQDIIKATERFGAFTRALGASEAETLGLAALMVDSGVQIRRGSTAINRTFQLMAVNVDAFGSALTEIKAVKSAKDFEKMFRADPLKAFETLLRGLNKQGGIEAATLLKTAGLHGNYISDLITMSRNVDKLTALTHAYNDELAKSGTEQSAVNMAYNANLKTFNASMKVLAGALENIKIMMGSPLLWTLSTFASALADISTYLMTWAGPLIKFAGLLLFVLAVGTTLGRILLSVKLAIAAIHAAGMVAFAGMLTGLMWFMVYLVAAIALLTLVVWLWNLAQGKYQTLAESLADVTGKAGQVSGQVMGGMTRGAMPAVASQGSADDGGGESLAMSQGAGALELPGAAAGGIVLQPTPVVVGEAGAEAIIPLRELASMLGNFAASRQPQPTETRVTVTSPIYLDGMEISRTVRESAATDSLRRGRLS